MDSTVQVNLLTRLFLSNFLEKLQNSDPESNNNLLSLISGGASVAPQVPLQLQLGQQQQQQHHQLLLEPPTPPLTPVTAISGGGGSVHHQPPSQQHLRSADPMHSAGAAVAINSFSVKTSGGFSDFVQVSSPSTGQGSMTTTVSSPLSDNQATSTNNNSLKLVNKNNNNACIPDQTQPQNLIVFDKNNKSADNLEQQNLQSQQSKLLQLQLEQFKQMQQQQQLSPYHHQQLQQQQQHQRSDLEKMSYEKLNLNLNLNLNSQQNHLNFHQLQTNNNDKNFVNNLKRVVDTTTTTAVVANTPTKYNHHHHHQHIVATTNKANHNESDDQPLDRSSSSVAFDLSSNKEDDSNMAADLADDNDTDFATMEQPGYDDSYESKVYLRSIESILEKSTLPQFFSPLLHMGSNQHETAEKNLLVDFEKLLTKYSSYLECGSEQCQLENVREHCHCCDEQCVGKILNKKEEIERHLKWHRKRMDSLNYGFLRFSSSDNCAPQFTGCPHNRKQTHYHCLQNNCDKTYISTSDVQMHANFHKKDSAIIQEGFQRYRATEECKAEYCMFFGQRTTHFHCRRDNCKYTFKNRADMEKHKTYHMKDEQLLRNGFKKFLKADPCPYSTCRFSQVCNHIHCIRENCEYVLHSSGQLLSHRRKHERMDSEKAYRRFKMTQKLYDTPAVSGAGSTVADVNMPMDLSASRPSTSDTSGYGNGNGASDELEYSEEESERGIKDERDSNDDSMPLNGMKKEDELDIQASYIPKIPGLPIPGPMPEEFLKLLPNATASTPPLSIPTGTPPISDDKASEAATLVDNLTLQHNFQLAYLALCQQNPFYFQGLYQLLGLPGLADPNKLLQAQLEQQQQQQQVAGTSGAASLLMPPAFPFSPESLLRLPHDLQMGLPNAASVPPMTAAMKQRQKRKLLHPDIDMSLTTAAKKLKNQANYKHNSNVKVFKDETVPEGYLKFRFNEDCNFTNCGYRNHQSHFHCCRADCFYSFCDKTRFVQHTARHERLDKLMGDDFKQYRANMRCEFEDCTYNRNLGPNNKSSHFHCLKCDFICADTSKVVAHRRQHSKMEFIQMAGFRKVSSNENCLENSQLDGSSDSAKVSSPSVAPLVLPFCTETPGDKPSPSGQSLSQPTTPTSGTSTPSLNNE